MAGFVFQNICLYICDEDPQKNIYFFSECHYLYLEFGTIFVSKVFGF